MSEDTPECAKLHHLKIIFAEPGDLKFPQK